MAIHPDTLAVIHEADCEQIPMLMSLSQTMSRLSLKHDGPMTDETEGYHRNFIEAIINEEEDITTMGQNANEHIRRACSVGYVSLWELTESENHGVAETVQEAINDFLVSFMSSDDPNIVFHAGFYEFQWMSEHDRSALEEEYTEDDHDVLARHNDSLTEDEMESLFSNGKNPELERFIQRNPNFPLVILSALYSLSETTLGKKPSYWHMFVMHMQEKSTEYSFHKDYIDLL